MAGLIRRPSSLAITPASPHNAGSPPNEKENTMHGDPQVLSVEAEDAPALGLTQADRVLR